MEFPPEPSPAVLADLLQEAQLLGSVVEHQYGVGYHVLVWPGGVRQWQRRHDAHSWEFWRRTGPAQEYANDRVDWFVSGEYCCYMGCAKCNAAFEIRALCGGT